MKSISLRIVALALGIAVLASTGVPEGVAQADVLPKVTSSAPVNEVPDTAYEPPLERPQLPEPTDESEAPPGSPQAELLASLRSQIDDELTRIDERLTVREVDGVAADAVIGGEIDRAVQDRLEAQLGSPEFSGPTTPPAPEPAPTSSPVPSPSPPPSPTEAPTPEPTVTPQALADVRYSTASVRRQTVTYGNAGCDPGSNPQYNGTVVALANGLGLPIMHNAMGSYRVRVSNTGPTNWPAGTTLSYRLFDVNTNPVAGFGPSTAITGGLATNRWVEFNANVGPISPGTWYIGWDINVPTIGWLSDRGVCSLDPLVVVNQPPSIAMLTPPEWGTVTTRTPYLEVQGTDIDGWPTPSLLRYEFKLCTDSAMSAGCSNSGVLNQPSWQVPAGTLEWNRTYYWSAIVSDGMATTSLQHPQHPLGYQFQVVVPTPDSWRQVGNGVGMTSVHGLVLPYGVFIHSAREAEVSTVNVPLHIERTFSSGALATEGAFGRGWTSVFDATAVRNPSTGLLTVTYPDGRQESFGQNPGGEYVGRNELGVSNRVTVVNNAVTVRQITGEVVSFDSNGRLLKVEYPGTGGWTLSYVGGLVNRITQQPSGRSIGVEWASSGSACSSATRPARPYVSAVSIDSGSGLPAARWLYSYSCSRLARVTDPLGGITRYSTTGNQFWSTTPEGRSVPGLVSLGSLVTVNTTHLERTVVLSEPGSPNRKIRLLQPLPGDNRGVAPISVYRSSYNSYAGVSALYCEERWVVNNVEECYQAYDQLLFDEQGRLRVKAFGEEGSGQTSGKQRYWIYNEINGQLTGMIDENSKGVSFSYDAYGNLKSSYVFRGLDQVTTTSTYQPLAQGSGVTRLSGVQVYPDYSGVNSSEFANMFSYDDLGRLIRREGPPTPGAAAGEVTTYAYTSGVETAVAGSGQPITGAIMPAGLLHRTTTAAGTTTRSYDVVGNLTVIAEADGAKTLRTYDLRGLTLSETSWQPSSQARTLYSYDALGRLISETYDCAVNAVTHQATFRKIQRVYDRDGLPSSVTDGEFDCASLAAVGVPRVTTWLYNAQGRMREQTEPGGAKTTFTYSASSPSQLLKQVDPRGRETEYRYLNGRLQNVIADVGPVGSTRKVWVEGYSYDKAGRLFYETDALSRGTNYYHTDDGLVARATRTVPTPNQLGREVDFWIRQFDGVGNVMTETQGGVRKTVNTYDSERRLVSTTLDPRTPQNPAGLNRTQTVLRDAAGRIIGSTLSDGTRQERTTFSLNSSGETTASSVWLSPTEALTTSTQFDALGNVTSTTDPRGNLAGASAANFTTTVHNDAQNRPTVSQGSPVIVDTPTIANSAADQTAFTGLQQVALRPMNVVGYNSFGEPTATLDALGRMSKYEYDAAGRLTAEHLPVYTPPGQPSVNPVIRYEYSLAGDVVRKTDERGGVTDYVYDVDGNVIRETGSTVGSQRPVTQYTYDAAGQILTTTSPTGAVTTFSYDRLGRTVAITEKNRVGAVIQNFVTSYTYDDLGNRTSVTTPAGRVTSFEYNIAGEVTAIRYPLRSQPDRFVYDVAGRVTKEIDGAGRAVEHVFDLAGREIATIRVGTDGSRLTTAFAYDASGNLVAKTNPRGVTTTYAVNAANQRTSVTQPISTYQNLPWQNITVQAGYDLVGNQIRTRNGSGVDTWTTFNSWNLPERVVEASTAGDPNLVDRMWTFLYDKSGNRTSEIKPGSVPVTREFDSLGRMTREEGQRVRTTDPPAALRTFGYDLDGRLTSATNSAGQLLFTWSDRDLLVGSSALGLGSSYGHDADGLLTTRATPNGTATFGRDGAGRASTLTDAATGVSMGMTYSPASGDLTSRTWPGGSTTWTYDAMGRTQLQKVAQTAGTVLEQTTYGYDGNDNVISETIAGGVQAGAVFEYDLADRLTRWRPREPGDTGAGNFSSGIYSRDFRWDSNNNLVGESVNVTSVARFYDARNRPTEVWSDDDWMTYVDTIETDPRGAITSIATSWGSPRQLSHDALDQLVQDGVADYTYDALGRVASLEGQPFQYVGFDSKPQLVPDARGTQSERISRDLNGQPLAVAGAFGARTLIADRRGDVSAGVGFGGLAPTGVQSGKVGYEPFGDRWSGSTWSGTTGGQQLSSLGFQGDWTNYASGAVWMGTRWYDTSLRSFLSRDSTIFSLQGPESLNLYGYANANPVKYIDPDGRRAITITPVKPAPGGTVPDFVPKEWVEKFGTVGQKVGQHLVGEGVEQAARVGTRIGTKFLPFLGWALLAVDVVTVAVIAYEVFFAPASPAWTPAPGTVPIKPPAPKPPTPTPRPIDKTLDFNKVGTAMSTSINALAGLAVGAVAGGGTGFGICGLSGSISSCLLPALDVTNNCASMTAAAHLCAPTEPVPGTPGRMGSAVDAAPVTAPGGVGQGGGGGSPPPIVPPECLPEQNSTPSQPRNADGTFAKGGPGENTAAATGRAVHDMYPWALGRNSGYEFNQPISPQNRKRPDAINFDESICRELKPNNPGAIARGWRQLERYRLDLENATGRPWQIFLDTYEQW